MLLFEPRLCTKIELDTVYSLDDFYDFMEIIEVRSALDEESRRTAKEEATQ